MPAKKGSKNTGNKAARIQWLLDNPNEWKGWPYGNALSVKARSEAYRIIRLMKQANLYSPFYNSRSINLVAIISAARTIQRHVSNGYVGSMPSKYLIKQNRENNNATHSIASA